MKMSKNQPDGKERKIVEGGIVQFEAPVAKPGKELELLVDKPPKPSPKPDLTISGRLDVARIATVYGAFMNLFDNYLGESQHYRGIKCDGLSSALEAFLMHADAYKGNTRLCYSTIRDGQ